jgi:hypothetical protein
MVRDRRVLHTNWDLYDTRHTVFQPKHLTPAQLEAGYWRAYKDFYRWGSILRGASAKGAWSGRLRHFAYAAGWKKFEPAWDLMIRIRKVTAMLPLLETILSEFGQRRSRSDFAVDTSSVDVKASRHDRSMAPSRKDRGSYRVANPSDCGGSSRSAHPQSVQ